jgi:PII-like signaling protein
MFCLKTLTAILSKRTGGISKKLLILKFCGVYSAGNIHRRLAMEGYLVTFFTQENREHNNISLASWLIDEAKKLGARGATLFSGQEGFGHDGHFRSGSFFDLEDRPQQVVLALTFDECERLFQCIEENELRIFYTKVRAEFGYICK